MRHNSSDASDLCPNAMICRCSLVLVLSCRCCAEVVREGIDVKENQACVRLPIPWATALMSCQLPHQQPTSLSQPTSEDVPSQRPTAAGTLLTPSWLTGTQQRHKSAHQQLPVRKWVMPASVGCHRGAPCSRHHTCHTATAPQAHGSSTSRTRRNPGPEGTPRVSLQQQAISTQ